MNINLVVEYQRWANRGLVTALICPYDGLDLFPVQMPNDKISLYCPRTDYRKLLGFGEYTSLTKKLDLVKRLFKEMS